MGKFDGKRITGLVGGLVFKKGRDKNITIVQSKAQNIRQTGATKDAGTLFGKASRLAKTFRNDFGILIEDYYDGLMINSFNKLNREILAHCYHKDTQRFTFKQDSFDRLKGFEFNTKSPLTNTLWVSPELSLTNNQLQLNLPEINIPEQLSFPLGANTCEIRIVLSQFILDQGMHCHFKNQSVQISKDQGIIPAQQFTFDVPDGCLCTVGMNLRFTAQKNNIHTVLNNKLYNPVAICGAIITPGTFIEPLDLKEKTEHWYYIPELKL